MTTRHLVDPELRGLADSFPTLQINDEMITQVRALSAGVTRRGVHVPGYEGGPQIRCLVYTPTDVGTAMPAYLHLHGSGYIMRSPEGADIQNIQLAASLGAASVSADYRLAPEHLFPAGLHDAYAALVWLFENANILNVNPALVAIGGEMLAAALPQYWH